MSLARHPPVQRLALATLQLPSDHPAAHLGRAVPVFGYVVDHPEGAVIVDTGVGTGNALIDELYRPTTSDLEPALAAVGIALDAVVAVVNSHLHVDHCGQNPLLFDLPVTFYAQRSEIAAVEADPFSTDRGWALAPPAQRCALDADEVIADGVTVLATPGHTAGHQSVVVESDGRRTVIGAQVVWAPEELETGEASAANVDPVPELQRAAVESIRRVRALEADVVLLSHCAG